MNIITLTTDFGNGSTYQAAMKGVILSINPAAVIVDITHGVPHQDVKRGAVVLDDVTGRFPPDTIHIAVVDPGVGTDRAIVYAKIGTQQYIAPDNGLLSRLSVHTKPSKILRLAEAKYWLPEVSSTFHGRDIMAPAAAHLSLGLNPDLLGPPLRYPAVLSWHEAKITDKRIEGEVLEIDSFGNLITNITADMIANRPADHRVCVVFNIYETWGIYHTYGNQLSGTLCAIMGSNNHLELAIVGDNAAQRLGIDIGTPVVLAWD
jgi:S-adenosyl-L-methionine hydrolase (adenosine-forming)